MLQVGWCRRAQSSFTGRTDCKPISDAAGKLVEAVSKKLQLDAIELMVMLRRWKVDETDANLGINFGDGSSASSTAEVGGCISLAPPRVCTPTPRMALRDAADLALSQSVLNM